MITLDAIRTAVLAPDPYTRMDDLVRAEMVAGRKVKEIFDSINPLVNIVLDTPGLTEDGEEALLGTLDALTGNCRSDQCYYDPPNTSLPTEEEIAKLPRWARVAFAARCARRAMIVYRIVWSEGHKHYQLEEQTLRECENSARLAGTHLSQSRVSYGTVFAGMPPVAATVASVVGEVFMLTLAKGNDVPGVGRILQGLRDGFIEAVDLQPYLRRDFDHIARLAQWQRWTDDTPVPPEVFGPLWPEGPPPGWPADPDTPQRTELPLAFLAREGTLPRVLEDEVVNLFNALNRYYILRTGDRLTVDGDIHTLLAALHPAGVS